MKIVKHKRDTGFYLGRNKNIHVFGAIGITISRGGGELLNRRKEAKVSQIFDGVPYGFTRQVVFVPNTSGD